MELLTVIGAAFVGGLILNVMPCVLPVLTMKLFHLVEHSENDAATNRMHGLAYSAGVVATFLALAAVIVALRAGGQSLGWGMQFQNAGFLAVMTALIFAFALNSLGVFEVSIGISGAGDGKEGYGSSFFNGVFATVLSTPCSAPLLGTATAYALGAEAAAWQTFLMFFFIGVGLASPFLLVTHVPATRRVLPRPGAWMDTFKQIMGFTLLATALWLYTVLRGKLSRDAGDGFLWFLLVLGLSLWAVERFGGLLHALPRRLLVRALSLAAVVGAGFWLIDLSPAPRQTPVARVEPALEPGVAGSPKPEAPVVKDGRINWVAYDKRLIDAAHQRQRPVFADFTADWCISCKANEKAVIETDHIRGVLTKTRVLPMRADMTDEDEVLEAEMKRLGRAGIPIYVIYYPDGSHELLPEVITVEMLTQALEKAATRYPPERFGPPA